MRGAKMLLKISNSPRFSTNFFCNFKVEFCNTLRRSHEFFCYADTSPLGLSGTSTLAETSEK